MFKLSRDLETVTREFGVTLRPVVFRDLFEIHGVRICLNAFDDKFPEEGEDQFSRSESCAIETVKLTSKGVPDKREKPTRGGGGDMDCVFGQALVELIGDEAKSLFGGRFAEKWERRCFRLERLIASGMTEEQLADLRSETAAEFVGLVAEAKALIEQNCV